MLPWQNLLANLSVLFVAATIWSQLRPYLVRLPPAASNAVLGIVMGCAAVLSMLIPYEVTTGIFVDLRSSAVATAGFFGGPLAAVLAAGAATLFRIVTGGAGTIAGVTIVVAAAILGVVAHSVAVRQQSRTLALPLLAISLAVCNTAAIFLLPSSLWATVFPTVAPSSAGLAFGATLLLGLMLNAEERQRELQRTNLLYRSVVEALPDCLNVKDLEGRFMVANPATVALMHARDEDDLIGKTDFDFFPEDVATGFRADEAAVIAARRATTLEQRLRNQDGSDTWLSTMKAPFRNADGTTVGIITHNRDISIRKALERKLAESQGLLAAALAHVGDGLALFDQEGRLLICNEQYRSFFPATADVRLPGAFIGDILRASVSRGEQARPADIDVDSWIASVRSSMSTASNRIIEVTGRRFLNVRTRPLETGGCLIVITDVTAQQRAQNALTTTNLRLSTLASTDGLTGLPNRRAFDEELAAEFSKKASKPLSLLLIDIDRFKAYNDTYGHPAGDACLQVVSDCLRQSLHREADRPARYGGEELAAILPQTTEAGALTVARAFQDALKQRAIPHLGSREAIVTASVGIACMDISGAGMLPADIVQRADEALYAAKKAGRNRIMVWEPLPPAQ